MAAAWREMPLSPGLLERKTRRECRRAPIDLHQIQAAADEIRVMWSRQPQGSANQRIFVGRFATLPYLGRFAAALVTAGLACRSTIMPR